MVSHDQDPPLIRILDHLDLRYILKQIIPVRLWYRKFSWKKTRTKKGSFCSSVFHYRELHHDTQMPYCVLHFWTRYENWHWLGSLNNCAVWNCSLIMAILLQSSTVNLNAFSRTPLSTKSWRTRSLSTNKSSASSPTTMTLATRRGFC